MLTANDKKILRRIREKVISTHWIKGDYRHVQKSGKGKGKEKCCLVGFVNIETLPPDLAHAQSTALGEVAAGKKVPPTVLKRRKRILDALLVAINNQATDKYGYIERFNDEKKTKRQDVVDVIDVALGDKSAPV